MSQFQFIEMKSDQQLQDAYSVLKELRHNLSYDNFLQVYQSAKLEGGYQILGLHVDEQLVAIMGYRYLHDFVRGKHLYIDDLVTSEKFQSKSYGALLLKEAEVISKNNLCSGLRLCTGIENERAKKFYERENWKYRAIVYTKKNEMKS